MAGEEKMVKIHIDLPNHRRINGESMWALPLGADRYQVKNVPFFAYGLNFDDTVEAIAPEPGTKPEIRRIVEPGGHRTIRVSFEAQTPREQRGPLLEQLNAHKASFENANGTLYAIDVEPEGDYDAVREQLDDWQREGLLDYETCEARVPGSFDEGPG
jgi:hypothetical protein